MPKRLGGPLLFKIGSPKLMSNGGGCGGDKGAAAKICWKSVLQHVPATAAVRPVPSQMFQRRQ